MAGAEDGEVAATLEGDTGGVVAEGEREVTEEEERGWTEFMKAGRGSRRNSRSYQGGHSAGRRSRRNTRS